MDAAAQDAPGYGDAPICWKCRGAKTVAKHVESKKERKRKHKASGAGGALPEHAVESVPCPVCAGLGRLPPRKRQVKHAADPGRVTRQRLRPPGWVTQGPAPVGAEGLQPEPGEELCSLSGGWRIFQRIGGHRWTTEDVVTAWYAKRCAEERGLSVGSALDLGCGIGSVLLMTAWQYPAAVCRGVEAQQLSASMAKRSVEFNLGAGSERVAVVGGDIREHAELPTAAGGAGWDLVTGTPPYFKVEFTSKGAAKPAASCFPSCEQSAPARFEFRGGIEVYCAAAAVAMRDDGVFVVVEQAQDAHSTGRCGGFADSSPPRVEAAAAAAGLAIYRRVDIEGRVGKKPLFSVFGMQRRTEVAPPVAVESIAVRDAEGYHTERYAELLTVMGIPPQVRGVTLY